MQISAAELQKRFQLRVRGVRQRKPLIGPEIVQLHLTNRCNLSCRYCFYHSAGSPHRPKEVIDFPFEKFCEIIQDCLDLKVDLVYFSGEGEPTMHPRFYDMLSFIEPLPLRVDVFSNGTFPEKHCIDMLKADRIKINLGDVDPERYRQLQGKDLFHKVVRNIQELVRLRNKVKPDFHIEVAYIINKLNVDCKEEMARFCKNLGVDSVNNVVAEIHPNTKAIALPDSGAVCGRPSERWVPCSYGWFYTSVRLDGKVNVCCYVSRIIAADLYNVSLKEAWHSEGYAKVRQMALMGKFREGGDDCKNCREILKNEKISLALMTMMRAEKNAQAGS